MTWEWIIVCLTKGWTAIKSVGILIGAIIGSITIYEKVVKPYQMRKRESVAVQDKFFADLRGLLTDVGEIKKEVMPNGGKSLNDKVTLMLHDVKMIKSRQKFTFRTSDTPMFWNDVAGYASAINSALIDLYGAKSEAQMLGHGWLNFVAPEDRERAMAEWNEAVNNNDEIISTFHVINGITKEKFEVTYRAIFERDNGVIVTICGTVERTVK